MKIEQLHRKRILILGYGKEGKATKEFLQKFVPDSYIDVADARDGEAYLERQAQFDLVIKTPGIPKRLVTIPYTTATNIFFSNLPSETRTIGVTGSKGKSTTSTLIYEILRAAGVKVRLVGNIGNPMLAELMHEVPKDTVFVMELSSYQLEDLEKSPDIAVFINIFPEHLDYHEGLEKYVQAKSQIALHAEQGNYFVYNSANDQIQSIAQNTQATLVPIIEEVPFKLNNTPIKGFHNLENIRAAVTVANLFQIDTELVRDVIESFHPLPHRMEFIGEYSEIKFYDDAIATAPEPTIYAIETLGNVDTIFLGGTDRGLDFTKLAKTICSSGIRNIVLFPDTGEKILRTLHQECKREFNVLTTTSMEAGVKFAFAHTEKGKSCLLSTASPSYTLWKDFEEKGAVYKKQIELQTNQMVIE